MLKFYKNKSQTFKCRVEVQGADSPKVIPRLILISQSGGPRVFFEGKYNDGQCEINIASTSNISSNKGDVVLEIIANNTVFTPWKSKYEIVMEQVVVESVGDVELVSSDSTPSLSLSFIEEDILEDTKPKMQKQKPKKKTIKENKHIEFLKRVSTSKRKKLLEHIQYSYKPNKQVLKWGRKQFKDVNSLDVKLRMFYEQNKSKTIKEDIKSKFPEVEEWDRNKVGSTINWKIVSKKKWNSKKAAQFQTQAGYDPMGYGGPDEYKEKKNIDGTFTISWSSGANS